MKEEPMTGKSADTVKLTKQEHARAIRQELLSVCRDGEEERFTRLSLAVNALYEDRDSIAQTATTDSLRVALDRAAEDVRAFLEAVDRGNGGFADYRAKAAATFIRATVSATPPQAETPGLREAVELESEREAWGAYVQAQGKGPLPFPEFKAFRTGYQAALTAAPAPAGWRGMESAPKDGTEILVAIWWENLGEWSMGVAYAYAEGWRYLEGDIIQDPEPKLWMPLPPAPQEGC